MILFTVCGRICFSGIFWRLTAQPEIVNKLSHFPDQTPAPPFSQTQGTETDKHTHTHFTIDRHRHTCSVHSKPRACGERKGKANHLHVLPPNGGYMRNTNCHANEIQMRFKPGTPKNEVKRGTTSTGVFSGFPRPEASLCRLLYTHCIALKEDLIRQQLLVRVGVFPQGCLSLASVDHRGEGQAMTSESQTQPGRQ